MPLVLFSGGMDSTVALFHAIAHLKRGVPLYALTFIYGQRHYHEVNAADRICRQTGINHRTVKIPEEFFPDRESSLFGTEPITKYREIPNHEEAKHDTSYIPHRNLLFFSIAAGYARKWGCTEIVTGLRGGFPDCDSHFESLMESVLQRSDPSFPLKLSSPCHGSRAETIGLAYSLPGCWGALAYSLTCFEGTEPPCGKCLPCLKRAEGFAKFGKMDPLLERLTVEAGSRTVPRY